MDKKWKRVGVTKLWVNIPDILYEKLKKYASKRNIKFSKYVNRALLHYIIKESEYEN